MKRNLIILFCLLVFISLSLIACNNMNSNDTNTKEADKDLILTDILGREIRIPENIERIVGVGAGALRIITYLGATDMVAGIEDFEKRYPRRPYILAHPEVLALPSIGPQHGGDAELIAAQEANLILMTFATEGEANELQKKTDIPVVVLTGGAPRTMDLENFIESFKLAGQILNKEERVNELLLYIEDSIADLKERKVNIAEEIIKVYIGGVGFRGSHGIVSTEPDYPPFRFINVYNVAGSLGGEHVIISEEKLLQWNPEIIFIDELSLPLVISDLNNSEFESLDALKENNLYALLPYNDYSTNFDTVLANSYYIGKTIYPEKFKDINPLKKVDEIYTKFTGKAVYNELKNIFGGYKRLILSE
jgi:iron complex transport system substrate-binding protein